MTITEIIGRADELAPNQYTSEQKSAWLRDFDGKVRREVFWRYEATGIRQQATGDGGDEATGNRHQATGAGDALLIPEPYAADVYTAYLLSKIAEANAETVKYNQLAAAFNAEYQQFVSWYNRTNSPKRAEGWRLGCRSCRI